MTRTVGGASQGSVIVLACVINEIKVCATCAHMAVLSEQTGQSAKWDQATETIVV